MQTDLSTLVSDLEKIIGRREPKKARFLAAANAIRQAGPYRWVGLYRVDHAEGMVRNIVWSGPMAPAFPSFSVNNGLTGSAIRDRKPVNVGDVLKDPRYLTALGSTQSELIVPVFNGTGAVVGTIDIESERAHAFDEKTQTALERCAERIKALWD